jgi:plastocyanin
MGEGARHAEDVRLIATLEIPLDLAAVAGSARRIFIATEEGELIVVDARRLDEPRIVRTVSLGFTVDALAANGWRIYALHPGGLTVLNLSEETDRVVEGFYPGIHGRGIAVAGRGINVASEGVISYVDRAVAGAVHPVTVSNNVFTPSSLNIAVGDTVEWTNVFGLHSVESCDGVSDPAQCSGVAAAGLFRSGDPATAPWTFSFTFDGAGVNPYYCAVHVAFGMTGSVTVTAPVVPPPGTPDGSGTTLPLTVAKAPFGLFQNRLEVAWDVATCTDAQGYQLLFGDGGNLPESFGGTYVPGDAVCSIGTSGGFQWNAPPNPLSGEFAWFLVVANDGSSEEGAWGKNSGNVERAGPGVGGSSLVCNAVKNLSNGCGP